MLPIAWVLIYALVTFPILWSIGDDHLYLASFALSGGLAVCHGIIEVLTNVSMRNFSRGGAATYIMDDSIKRLGWMRIGLVLFFGLIPSIFMTIFL